MSNWPPPKYIDNHEIAWAREALRNGMDPIDVARRLRILQRDLDITLWTHIGRTVPRVAQGEG